MLQLGILGIRLMREYKRGLSIMGNLMCGFIHISFYNMHTELNVCVMSRISVHYHIYNA